MKHNIGKLVALVAIVATSNAALAKMFYVTNATPFPANVTAKWAACSTDFVAVNPGQKVAIDGKGCLMTELSATVTQSGTVTIGGIMYQAQYTGSNMGNVGKIINATPYTSSGQSVYTEFYIIGPLPNGRYQVARIVS